MDVGPVSPIGLERLLVNHGRVGRWDRRGLNCVVGPHQVVRVRGSHSRQLGTWLVSLGRLLDWVDNDVRLVWPLELRIANFQVSLLINLPSFVSWKISVIICWQTKILEYFVFENVMRHEFWVFNSKRIVQNSGSRCYRLIQKCNPILWSIGITWVEVHW